MVKVTASRPLSVVDGGRRVAILPDVSTELSAEKAERLAKAGMVTIVKAEKAPKKPTTKKR